MCYFSCWLYHTSFHNKKLWLWEQQAFVIVSGPSLSIIETEGRFESDIEFRVWSYSIKISKLEIFFRNESGIEEVSLTLKILKFPLYELSNLKFYKLKPLVILFLKYSSKLKIIIKFILHMKS